ncbi:MAG TPA: tetratricopeptide repeat protein [Spirochaetia bacterium]|nr:tetratricopeptide repeat protein [Spirochaetia bacterium]
MRRTIVLFASLFIAASAFAAGTGGGGGGGGTGGGMGGGARMAPTSALDWYNAGYSASDQHNYQEAVTDFKNAISLRSDYAEAYNMLGFCTRKLGNVNEAFAYYEKALKLKPNFPEAREYYGEAYLQEGDLAKAVQQYIILEKAGNKNARELLEKIDVYVNQKS